MTSAALLVVSVYRRILHVNQTTVALTFLVMVQVAAFRWGLVYSVCLAIGCTLLYNFFFLPPIYTFTIAAAIPTTQIESRIAPGVPVVRAQGLDAAALLKPNVGKTITVNAGAGSERFWKALGFTPDRRDGHRHVRTG